MNNEPVAWTSQDVLDADHIIKAVVRRKQDEQHNIPLYTAEQLHPAKTLTDEEWNKAFEYYCETDEGVLRFNYELRDEWKKEQLIRWKEALRKAQEK